MAFTAELISHTSTPSQRGKTPKSKGGRQDEGEVLASVSSLLSAEANARAQRVALEEQKLKNTHELEMKRLEVSAAIQLFFSKMEHIFHCSTSHQQS